MDVITNTTIHLTAVELQEILQEWAHREMGINKINNLIVKRNVKTKGFGPSEHDTESYSFTLDCS